MRTTPPIEPRTLRLSGDETFQVWWALGQEMDRSEASAAMNFGDPRWRNLMLSSLRDFKACHDVRARLSQGRARR